MTDPLKIALIEDDDFIARMYRTKFTLAGFAVTVARDGEEGLHMVKELMPDIVLLDIMLPKLNGWEVLQVLKQTDATKHIPVLLLTNIGAPEDVKRGLSLGAADYMIKAHFVPEEVVAKIKSIIQPD